MLEEIEVEIEIEDGDRDNMNLRGREEKLISASPMVGNICIRALRKFPP